MRRGRIAQEEESLGLLRVPFLVAEAFVNQTDSLCPVCRPASLSRIDCHRPTVAAVGGGDGGDSRIP